MRIRWTRALFIRTSLALVLVLGLATTVTASQGPRFRVHLTGANEVPPADPDGDARARITIKADEGLVCFDIKVDDIGTPNRAHIHTGEAGVNGGIVVPFFELREVPTDPRNDRLEKRDRLRGCVTAEPDLLQQIADNPELFYVNVHNSRFPGGAVRAQLDD